MPEPEDIGDNGGVGHPAAVAVYIGALTEELGQLARANGFEALGYILDMARMEANEVCEGYGGREP